MFPGSSWGWDSSISSLGPDHWSFFWAYSALGSGFTNSPLHGDSDLPRVLRKVQYFFNFRSS